MAMRFDVSPVRKPEVTPQGFLRVDAHITRSGVFAYRNNDGTVRKEYRPPDEVFHQDALASFEDAPVTREHPSEMVTASNAKQFSIGTVKEKPRRDGDVASTRLLITDAAAIADVKSGKLSQISQGYHVDYDPTPGTTPEGQRYDGIQRNMRGNHVALLEGSGRAGNGVKVRLDAADAVLVEDSDQPDPKVSTQEKALMKIRIDGVEYDVPEQTAQAIQRDWARRDAEFDTAKKASITATADADKAKARADGLDDELKKEKAARADASDEKKINERVSARVALLATASKVLDAETKLDDMSDDQIRRAVIVAVSPEAKLDGKSADYIAARFDQALEQIGNERVDALGQALGGVVAKGSRLDEEREKLHKKSTDAWKQPLSAKAS